MAKKKASEDMVTVTAKRTTNNCTLGAKLDDTKKVTFVNDVATFQVPDDTTLHALGYVAQGRSGATYKLEITSPDAAKTSTGDRKIPRGKDKSTGALGFRVRKPAKKTTKKKKVTKTGKK